MSYDPKQPYNDLKLGILKGEKRGREVLYEHPALLKVLTA